MVEALIALVEGLHFLIEFGKILREDPRIAWALTILLVAGYLVAILIRGVRREEPLSIRTVRK